MMRKIIASIGAFVAVCSSNAALASTMDFATNDGQLFRVELPSVRTYNKKIIALVTHIANTDSSITRFELTVPFDVCQNGYGNVSLLFLIPIESRGERSEVPVVISKRSAITVADDVASFLCGLMIAKPDAKKL